MTTRVANDLILDSLLLIGEWDPNEIVQPQFINQGLKFLNLIIDYKSVTSNTVPLYSQIDFNMVVGQSVYTVSDDPLFIAPDITAPRIVSIEYCNVLFNAISYPVRPVTPTQIYTTPRYTQIQFRPIYVLLTEFVDHSKVEFFPLPNMAYPTTLRTKSYLGNFTLDTPINNIPLYYQYYLVYLLAKDMAMVFPSASWDANKQNKLDELERKITAANQIDYTVETSQLLESYRRNDYSMLQVV